MIQVTTALRKITALKKRIRVVQGGQGAAKTFGILIILIDACIKNKGFEVYIASLELTKMRITVIKDFVKIMKMLGVFEQHRFLAGTEYNFKSGSTIKFLGLDKADIGKGLRSDVVFVNEANKINFETYRELTSRAKNVYLDFNPNDYFWVHSQVVDRDDCDFIKLTFEDNEALDIIERNEILSYKEKGETNSYWANKWRVYGLGEIGSLEGAVYQHFKPIEKIPEGAEMVACGCDFGFSNDPTAVVGIYKYEDAFILDEIVYQTGLINSDLASKINHVNVPIWCDPSRPDTITDLRRSGIKTFPSKLVRGIIEGISVVQETNIYLTKASVNIWREQRTYVWKIDKTTGTTYTNVPIDENNHAMDALRYGLVNCVRRKKSGNYTWG